MNTDDLIPCLAEIADEVIVPRFRALAAGDIEEKSPGELVTIADRQAEERIRQVLRELSPHAVVIGEEAVETNPNLLDALKTNATCWLIDPLDGTANFVNGRREFAVMVALVRAGESIGAWIWLPLDRIGYIAERGSGAFRNGEPLHVPPPPESLAEMRGAVLAKFLDADQKGQLRDVAPRFTMLGPGQYCAGIEYPLIAEGRQEFVRFQRLRPWDHAPGTLLLEEAGGYVRRWDGTCYSPGTDGAGLLATPDETSWKLIRSAIQIG